MMRPRRDERSGQAMQLSRSYHRAARGAGPRFAMMMPHERRLPFALAVTLAALAGWVDAVGFLHFAHLFLSFMSGNSTKLAVAIGGGEWNGVLAPLLAIIGFVLGCLIGGLIAGVAGAWRLPAITAAEALLLAASLALQPIDTGWAPSSIPVAIAMGVQNSVLRKGEEISVGLTYVTGTLVKLGQSFADAILGRSGPWRWTIYAIMWLALTGGAVCGTLTYGAVGYHAMLVPAGAFAATAIAASAYHVGRP